MLSKTTYTIKRRGNYPQLVLGFTLIETIIYIALLALIVGSGVVAAFYLVDSSENEKTKLTTTTESAFLMRKIGWTLDGVDVINTPPPGTTSVSLSINKQGYTSNPLLLNLSSGRVHLKEGTGAPVELTSDRVTITNLAFEHIPAASPKPAAIRTSFTADGNNFSTTIYLHQ